MAKSRTEKRKESTKQYIDTLSEQYSKLNIVRVDLAYKKPYSQDITLEDANKDVNRMFNNMRSKPSIFKDKVGYICKKEYTEDKGLHLHTIIVYDGQKVQKDAFKGDEIGKYWNDEITKGKGSYHNCNRNNYEKNGIGMLDHRDTEKRKILDEKVISYLCKDEQDIGMLKENKKDRAFTRGTLPKKKGNIGRPRGESNI
jgi:hypothetical protein